jgi:hypothetical protein
MGSRTKHPNKEMEAAIVFAEDCGWRYARVGNSAHAWGRLLCSLESREGCAMSIWSTPRNASVHVKQILRRVNQCPHC